MGQAARKYQEQWAPGRHKLEVIETRPGPQGQRNRKAIGQRQKRGESQKKTKSVFQLGMKAKGFLISAALLTFSLLLANLMYYNELSIAHRELVTTKSEIQSMKADYDYIQMKIAPYLESDRIESIAKNRLHMSRPDEGQMMKVTVDPSKTMKKSTTFKKVADNNQN